MLGKNLNRPTIMRCATVASGSPLSLTIRSSRRPRQTICEPPRGRGASSSRQALSG
jgi:hypothetical protein